MILALAPTSFYFELTFIVLVMMIPPIEIVYAEDDFEKRQRDERNPGFRRGQPFHRGR